MLAIRLENEEHEGRRLRVFFDEWDIAPGENILTRIEEGLRNSRFLAVAISPAMARADWPGLEWQSQVYDDPMGKRARIIPLIVKKYDDATMQPVDIPLPLRVLRYLDFSAPERFEPSYELLVARLRGQRAPRGRGTLADAITTIGLVTGPEAPDPVEEAVLANLLPAQLPTTVFSAVTPLKRNREVWDALGSVKPVPFILHAGRIYSFARPGVRALPPSVFTGPVKEEDPATWLEDEDLARLLVRLCNAALQQHCYGIRIRSPHGQRHLYYAPTWDEQPRRFTWGKGKPITLAKVAGEAEKRLGVHRSAHMRFLQLERRLHLLIEPGWFFTTDGVTPLQGRQVGIFSVKWGGREGNDTVLRQTLMWARLIASSPDQIVVDSGGSTSIRIATVPIYGRVNLGLAYDTLGLDHLLAGQAAGEVVDDVDELDLVAAAHRAGSIDGEGDDFSSAADDVVDSPDEDSLEPELPF